MKNYRSKEMKTAYKVGGYRERYAMEHGKRQPYTLMVINVSSSRILNT